MKNRFIFQLFIFVLLQKAGNILDFCNEAVKLNGSVPLSTSPFITYSSTTLTAITVTTTGHNSIAFLGTSMGALKKVTKLKPYLFSLKFVVSLFYRSKKTIKLDMSKWHQLFEKRNILTSFLMFLVHTTKTRVGQIIF